MEMASQQAAPSAVVEGSTPTHNECKRKVVDNIEAEKRCKFKEDPLMMKATLEIEAMRWRHDMNIVRRQNGTKKELHVLKQQLKEERELHKRENELQQE